jgi:hypothetical protein
VVRESHAGLRHLADGLIAPMNFGIVYDNRAETHCSTNPGEHSLVEVYRLSRSGIDKADRFRRAGGSSVPHLLVRVDLRLDRAGPLLLVQDEPAGCDGYAHTCALSPDRHRRGR